jgi:ribosomal protein S18 acetylase RimI-like enzyme
MALEWTRDNPPRWDADKQRIVGDAPAGIFDSRYRALREGDAVPGEWWRVEDGGSVVGYGWLDVVWGDAEILLATAPGARRKGVGALILDRLAGEARARGLSYLCNIVRPTHPDGEAVSKWLRSRGFTPDSDGRLVRAVG